MDARLPGHALGVPGSLLGLLPLVFAAWGVSELSASRLNDRVDDLGIACALLPALPLLAPRLPGWTSREHARSTKARGRAPCGA